MLTALAVLHLLLLAGTPMAAEVANAPQSEPVCAVRIAVRLFVDLECPHCRRAWPTSVQALADHPCATALVHHLPVSHHPNAMLAAQVALVARQLGKELQFIDAVFASGGADELALTKALTRAGLDPAVVLPQAKTLQMRQAVDRERQAALAFGVSVTPSALIHGRGMGGTPPLEAIARALGVAQRRALRIAAEIGPAGDNERASLCGESPEFAAAFDALRASRAGTAASRTGTGDVGALYRVAVHPTDTVAGVADAAVTLVLFVDPARPWTSDEVRPLLAIQARQPAVRVVVKWVAAPGPRQAEAVKIAALLQAWTQAPARQGLANELPSLVAGGPLSLARVQAALTSVPDEQRRRIVQAAATGDVAVVLQANADLARRVDAQPGAVFVQGRRWLGRASDAGMAASVSDAQAAFAARAAQGGVAHSEIYAALIARGIWRSDADLDLGPPEDLALDAVPQVGNRGPTVVLLVDVGSQASRAAWFMLRHHVQPGAMAIRLQIAALPRRGKSTPAGVALAAATVLGRQVAAADALFASANPDDAATVAKVAAICQLRAPQWLDVRADVRVTQVANAVAALRQRANLGDEPVIAIDGRLYLGPLDEARLQQAIFAPRAAAVPLDGGARSPTGGAR